jgi:hypothetical protein
VHNRRRTAEWSWYGEGDDMIFIDEDDEPFAAPHRPFCLPPVRARLQHPEG